MTTLQTVPDSSGAIVAINENFRAVSPAGLYGFNAFATTGLNFNFYGGRFLGNTVADGSVTLTASTTNYIVADRSTGAVTTSTGTTDWDDTDNFLKLYSVVTDAASIFSMVDERQAYGASDAGSGGDVVGPASSVSGRVATFSGTTGKLIQDGGTLLSALAPLASPAFTGTATAANITYSGLALTAASATGGAGFRLPHGAAPTSPTNGDVWTTTAGMYAQINGSTVGPFGAGGGGGMTNPMTTTGDIIYSSSGSTPARLGIGSTGQVLGIASGVPSWVAAGGFTGGALTSALDEAKGTDIARATTTNIGAATGNFVHLTGTTTVTGLGTVQAGTRRIVRFAGAGTLTHNATSLILPGGASITTAANDCAIFVSEGSGNWRCIAYSRASGLPIVNPTVSVASLTNWTGSLNTASPNGTVNAARLLVTGGTTDGDAVISPKGGGAFQLHLADGTSAGGDKRGTTAVDLQLSRSASTQVASGQSAFAAGASNTASGQCSSALGEANNVSGTYASATGNSHTVSGYGAAALGGSSNVLDGQRAATLGGNYLHTRGLVGLVAFGLPGQVIAAANRKQGELLALGASTTNATPVQMGSEGNAGSSNNQFLLNNNSVITVQGSVVAMDITSGDVKGWVFSATVKRGANAAATAVVGTPTVTVTGNDAGASSWAVAIVADTTYGGLGIRVTGQAAKSIEWTASGIACFNSQ